MPFRITLWTLASLLAMAALVPVHAQTGQVKLVVGYPPGGSADATARAVADKLAAGLGVPVVVENKPGAAGRLAAESLKHAAPDGNTVLITPLAPVVLAPLVFRKLAYAPETDFVPVAQLAKFHLMIATGAAGPFKTLDQLVTFYKANPAKANFGTSGTGSQLHFLGVMFGRAINVDLVHVPYQGGAPLNTDLIGGQIPAGIDTLVIELHKAGKLRMLAVSGETRSALAPDIPTFKEQGYPTVVGEGWMGAYVPARTPPAIVQKLSAALGDAVRDGDVRQRLELAGLEPTGLRATEFAAVIAADNARWKPIVQASGFKGD